LDNGFDSLRLWLRAPGMAAEISQPTHDSGGAEAIEDPEPLGDHARLAQVDRLPARSISARVDSGVARNRQRSVSAFLTASVVVSVSCSTDDSCLTDRTSG
jgi:hypothetical protein